MGRRVLLLVLFSVCLQAQERNAGYVRGVVTDAAERNPLVGANVSVLGTVLGASTNAEGVFRISKLPPGNYSLTVSMVGYGTKTVRNVKVVANDSVGVRVELEQVALQTEAVVVTASKREQSLQEVPVSVSVLDSKLISQRGAITIDQALRYVPGVNIVQGQINIRGSSGYTRGVGSRVLLLVDGLPFLAGDSGEIIWEAIPTAQVDRVEVVKGAGSALYGSSALGGVVNVITKNTKEEPLTIAKIYGGIYSKPYYEEWDWSGEHRLFSGMTLSHSRRLDRLSFLLSLSRVQDEGYRENDYYRRLQGFAKFKYEFTPFVSWSVLLNALNQKSGNYYFWRDLRHALQPPENSLGELVNTTRWSIGSEFKHFVGERFFYTAKAILYRSDWKDNIGHPYSDSIGDHSTSDFVDFELQSNYQLDSSQVLTAGLDGTFNLVASNLFGDRSGFGAAAYTQYELKVVDALRLTLGIRLDYRKLDSLDANSQVNPKLGFVFDVCSGTAVRGSVGRGFRAPSIGEAFTSLSTSGIIIQPNPRLKPESSWSFEVGGTQRVSDYTVLDVALFQNEFWDLIQPKFLPNGRAVFDNVTRARIQGMEISARMGWFKKMINTELSYTYLYPRDVDLNEALKYRPRNLFYASANVDYGPIQIGADFRYMSKIENIDMDFVTLGIIRDGDQRGSAYVVDARLNFDVSYFGLPVFVGLNVNNMLQYNYVELIGNIAPIRNFVLTIEGRF